MADEKLTKGAEEPSGEDEKSDLIPTHAERLNAMPQPGESSVALPETKAVPGPVSSAKETPVRPTTPPLVAISVVDENERQPPAPLESVTKEENEESDLIPAHVDRLIVTPQPKESSAASTKAKVMPVKASPPQETTAKPKASPTAVTSVVDEDKRLPPAPSERSTQEEVEESDLIPAHAERLNATAQPEESSVALLKTKAVATPASPIKETTAKTKALPPVATSVVDKDKHLPSAPLPVGSTTKPPLPPAVSGSAQSVAKPNNAASKANANTSLGLSYQALEDREPISKRWFGGAVVFCMVFAGIVVGQHLLKPYLQPEAFNIPSFNAEMLGEHTDHSQRILREIEQARTNTPLWDSLSSISGAPTEQTGKTQVVTPSKKPGARRRSAELVRKEEPPDPIAMRWEARFGNAEEYHEGSIRGRPAAAPVEQAPMQVSSRGKVLQARLQDEVASAPTGANLIATLTQTARLGDATLPVGTELHGTVSGTSNEDARIIADFSLVRLSDGTSFAFSGSARDAKGRAGIPGIRPLTARTAGSVGLAGATKAMEYASQGIPVVGGYVSAGVKGAADAASGKAQRVDRDEVIVVVARHTPFAIYVHSANTDF